MKQILEWRGLKLVRHFQVWDALHCFFDRKIAAPCCGRLTDWVINRNGKTRCPECDDAECARVLERELAFARLG
jgi:hypothetical protein